MKKVNFFSSLFFNSKKTIEKINPQLESLEAEMKKIEAMENRVEAIIRLFQVISPIQDAGGFSQEIFDLKKHNRNGKFDDQIEALEVLQAHFYNAGRSKYGINRTVKGEEITKEKVFLGNVFGLLTKTAAYWLSQKSILTKQFRPDVSKDAGTPVSNWYLINDYQCGSFVKSHTDGILEQIKVLKAA